MPQLHVERMAHLHDVSGFDGAENGAAGFADVEAIVEPALPQVRGEYGKGALEHAFGQVIKAEFLKTGGIDDGTVVVEPIQPRKSGGVLAAVERFRYLAHSCFRLRHLDVDQRGLSHAGLADEDGEIAGQ